MELPFNILGAALAAHVLARALVIWRFLLLGCRREHGEDGHADLRSLKCWRPILIQRGQADVAIRVDMFMHRRCAHKLDFRCFERVLVIEPELEGEHFALVYRVLSTIELYMPDELGLVHNV